MRGCTTIVILFGCMLAVFQSGCDKGTKAVPTNKVADKAKNDAPASLKMFTKPDIALAANKRSANNNDYVRNSANRIEVLSGWRVIAKIPVEIDRNTNVAWYLAGLKQDGQTAFTFEYKTKDADIGIAGLEFKGVASVGGVQTTYLKNVFVGEVTSTRFNLIKGGDYKKRLNNPNWLIPPLRQAILMNPNAEESPKQVAAISYDGIVNRTQRSAVLNNFKWGFVQSFTSSQGQTFFDRNNLTPKVNVPGFPYWAPDFPNFLETVEIPGGSNFNDAAKDHVFYNENDAIPLGTDSPITNKKGKIWFDDPGTKFDSATLGFGQQPADPSMSIIDITFEIKRPSKAKIEFMVWQVVIDEQTQHYVPLKQQSWGVAWDATQAGPFPVSVNGTPADPSSPLPDCTNPGPALVRQSDSKSKLPKR